VQKARVFPYQLMVAYKNAAAAIPLEVRNALHAALEIATENVPAIEGKVYVCPDVSGSMHSALTGSNGSTPSTVRCIDVAALVTAAIVRKNRDAEILPFDTKVVDVFIDPNDEVLWNAEVLAAINGGGTTVSAPLAKLNKRKAIGDLVILVSDNESWADPQSGRGTELMREWNAFVQRNPNARLVCIDIQPNATTQAQERTDVLNVGGFSDAVFPLIADFATGRLTAGHWVEAIERISLADEAVA
ncbi:MAG TPA: RNA-binding protein, partial [Thermoanaerobaculia bacterium]